VGLWRGAGKMTISFCGLGLGGNQSETRISKCRICINTDKEGSFCFLFQSETLQVGVDVLHMQIGEKRIVSLFPPFSRRMACSDFG
jgi:hypothetical protein